MISQNNQVALVWAQRGLDLLDKRDRKSQSQPQATRSTEALHLLLQGVENFENQFKLMGSGYLQKQKLLRALAHSFVMLSHCDIYFTRMPLSGKKREHRTRVIALRHLIFFCQLSCRCRPPNGKENFDPAADLLNMLVEALCGGSVRVLANMLLLLLLLALVRVFEVG